MKRYFFPTIIITTVSVMILTALIICLRTDGKSGELKYNGQTVSDQNVTVYRRTAHVPALEVLNAIGADITWLDDEQAVISYSASPCRRIWSTPPLLISLWRSTPPLLSWCG